MRRRFPLAMIALLAAACGACATTAPQSTRYSPILHAEPAAGSIQTRMPRTLRLYYNALPDVARSSLTLLGPEGEVPLRGLHTMAADDLMIEIMAPLANGDYAILWTTFVAGDPAEYAGEVNFSVAVEPD